MGLTSSKPPPDNGVYYMIVIIILLIFIQNLKEKIEKEEKNVKTIVKSEFDKIIGLESVKEEIKYYMDFIKNKKKYKAWGVKLPKGILLAGPPGTGKTLLVKTLSKKLDIPFNNSLWVRIYRNVCRCRSCTCKKAI